MMDPKQLPEMTPEYRMMCQVEEIDQYHITTIFRQSKRLLKIRKPKAAEKKPVDRAKVKAARAQRVRNRGR